MTGNAGMTGRAGMTGNARITLHRHCEGFTHSTVIASPVGAWQSLVDCRDNEILRFAQNDNKKIPKVGLWEFIIQKNILLAFLLIYILLLGYILPLKSLCLFLYDWGLSLLV
jgi:hypothetical protein